MKEYLSKLAEKRDLTYDEAKAAMQNIMSGDATDAQIGAFLIALKMKGESVEEISAFAQVMRQYSLKVTPKVDGTLVDVCGTGGDGKSTFNISTASMFVVAAAGVPVAKHGNRSITSKSGSADVLEALGVNIGLNVEQITASIEKIGVGFMFAPQHHPAMKHVMPARKQLGVRTVFNILGPLTNPASAKAQVMGVFDPDLTEKLANVFGLLGVEHAVVVHGEPGIDEISNVGNTKISELKDGAVTTYSLSPQDFGVGKADIQDILGSTAADNAQTIKDIFSGADTGPKMDIVALNASAGLLVAGNADSLKNGYRQALDIISSGKALKKLTEYVEYTKNVVH
ncbi:MAG: anthranilate phosphoribosyltransferase [Candidatus Altiarchaeota archaeon]|nr:anthranilate phosphoribosyltransferase [Candidatus Altiarchaeota archaeon]